MAVRSATMAYEDRGEPRDETLHRTRLSTNSGATPLVTIVNVSPNGFMARTDEAIAIGDIVTVTLPVAGNFAAEVRWALGGRIGCKLAQELPPSLYQFVLAAMR